MNRVGMRSGLLLVLWLMGVGVAYGQQATERYIPIGRSPGVSGTDAAVTGRIVSADPAARRVEIRGRDGARAVTMDAQTRYYLDRTGRRRSNRMGGYEDCQVGRTVEAKVRPDGTVDWIKIETR